MALCLNRKLICSAEELSEEDQQLKSDLDMLAERILVGYFARIYRMPTGAY